MRLLFALVTLSVLLVGCVVPYASRRDTLRLEERIEALRLEQTRLRAEVAALRASPPAAREQVVILRVEQRGEGDEITAVTQVPSAQPAEGRPALRQGEMLFSPLPPEGTEFLFAPDSPASPTSPQPRVGTLRIGAQGFYCDVAVDEVPVGATPTRPRTVTAGLHRVTCANPNIGYQSAQTVEVKVGRMTPVIFLLHR